MAARSAPRLIFHHSHINRGMAQRAPNLSFCLASIALGNHMWPDGHSGRSIRCNLRRPPGNTRRVNHRDDNETTISNHAPTSGPSMRCPDPVSTACRTRGWIGHSFLMEPLESSGPGGRSCEQDSPAIAAQRRETPTFRAVCELEPKNEKRLVVVASLFIRPPLSSVAIIDHTPATVVGFVADRSRIGIFHAGLAVGQKKLGLFSSVDLLHSFIILLALCTCYNIRHLARKRSFETALWKCLSSAYFPRMMNVCSLLVATPNGAQQRAAVAVMMIVLLG